MATKLEHPKVIEFLEDYNEKQRPQQKLRIVKFLEWTELTPNELLKLDNKKARALLIKFNDSLLSKGVKPNSLRAYVSTAKMFFAYHNIHVTFRRGQTVQPEKPSDLYDFSNGDLGKIYEVANPQYKAIISLACSTGFGIGDILALNRETIKSRIAEARRNNKEFCFYETQRIKTHARSLVCINPLAMKSLELWLKQPHNKETLFEAKELAINKMLKKLAKKIGIDTKLKIKFHRIRSWLINSLIKAGFSTEQWKSIVGKAISMSDDTYLSLRQQIEEKYRETYNQYFNILGMTTKKYSSEIETLENAMLQLEKENKALKTRIETMHKDLKHMTIDFNTRLSTLEKIERKKPEKVEF